MHLKFVDIEKLGIVASILEKDYQNNYSHEQLAVIIDMNEFTLRAGFKQVYKTTIHNYLTKIRIQKAKEILKKTDGSLDEIAMIIGFKEPSSLIKNFKKFTGLTPYQWKLQHIA